MQARKYRELPAQLYTAAEVRELDRLAIEELHIPGFELMRRAGRAAFKLMRELWPDQQQITVYCGAGNNGGDGFIVASQARLAGLVVRVVLTAPQSRLRGSALQAYQQLCDSGVVPVQLDAAELPAGGLIVDAILGTGIGGEVSGAAAQAIASINRSGLPVLALDVPSGLCSDTGRELGSAVRATATCSFIGLKRGLFTASGPDCAGDVYCDDLSVSTPVYAAVPAGAKLLSSKAVPENLGQRHRDSHKGRYGHVLVIGGDYGMAGAALMAAEAAGRVGAGLVSVATRPEHCAAIVARRPEVMAHAVKSVAELDALLQQASVVAIGPGLGKSPWAEQLLYRALASELPLVVDADALNLLVTRFGGGLSRGNWVLTPHPGEAGRLLEVTTAAIQADRFSAAAALALKYQATVVLKGAGSLIASPGLEMALCPFGNPGMASGGMGDVLTGVIAGLAAQGLALPLAAQLGVVVHALAADLAADGGIRGLLASDVVAQLRKVVNP